MPTRTAVYTGSFDPFHLGHEEIVRRASTLFDHIIVGVGVNPEKVSSFTPEERVAMISECVADLPNVAVRSFTGLTVQFVRDCQSRILLRGIRALADLDYEFTMSLTNASLDSAVETVFLMAHKEFTHLSSSLIRQIAALHGNLTGFVPAPVMRRLVAQYAKSAAP